MKNEKMNLQEATLKALYDQLDDSKDVDEVEGLVDNILVVTDPKVNSEEYEEVIERAQEIVEDTPEGEIPYDEEWNGQYLQTCPICGATFVTDEILEPGAICPVCTQVPEAFVMVGRVETDEQVAKDNNIDIEEENNEEEQPFVPETFENEEELENEEDERVIASEQIQTSDNKLEESKDLEEDVEILEEDRLNFKKYGIERLPEEDFSDDGNRFRCYICNGVPISYLYSDGRYYLSIRVDYLHGLTYNEYSKLPSYKDCDKYNMCDEIDLQDVADICKRIKAEYDEALKNIKDVSDDEYKAYTDKYLEKAKREFEEAKNSIRSLEPEDLLNASEYEIKDLKRYLQSVKDKIDSKNWDRRSQDDQITRRYNLGNDTEEQYKEVSWYLTQIKEIVNDITLKRTSESLHENKEEDIQDILEIVNEAKEIKTEDLDNVEDLDDVQIASIEDVEALDKAGDALNVLWDTIEGGESEFLGKYKGDIADLCDKLDKILDEARLSRKSLDESKKVEDLDDEVDAFDKQLEEAGITTTNKLYYVTGTPDDCHTVEEADEYYEILPKWDSTNYWRDKDNITQEQFELIDKNRKLAKEILKRAADNVRSYGPLD